MISFNILLDDEVDCFFLYLIFEIRVMIYGI